MTYSDIESMSRSTKHILKLCLLVRDLHVKVEDLSSIIT
jgi:hypothetical protein